MVGASCFMDSETISSPKDWARCCRCGCSSCSTYGSSGTWLRSVKRKYDEFEQNDLFVPGLVYDSVARVQAENEIVALREMVSSQQQAIQHLLSELEEERNASRSAANEAMSMILRLQREKAEVQMEARQFKRFAEEKMGHDQQEILALEEFLYKREQAIQSLTCEAQAYKHRMMSYGLTEAEADGENSRSRSSEDSLDSPFDLPTYEYPLIKCYTNEKYANLEDGEDDVVDIENYVFGETPRDHLKNLEFHIYQTERNPTNVQLRSESPPRAKNIPEKIIIGQSPPRPRHHKKLSADRISSFFGTDSDVGSDMPSDSPRLNDVIFRKTECPSQPEEYSNLRRTNDVPEAGDDASDRIYTVDSVHKGVPNSNGGVGSCEDHFTTPGESWVRMDLGDPDIKKLYSRLRSLEADRASMRHTIMSMQTDRAQILLLKEIAQQLCKDVPAERSSPRTKTSSAGKFTIGSMFKWMGSFIFRRKRARQSKYMFGLSPHNVGLLMVLDKDLQTRQRKLLTRTITNGRVQNSI